MNAPLREALAAAWPCTEDGSPATLVAALARNAAESGSRPAFRERDRGIWQERNWAETFTEVLALAAALETCGLRPGQALIIIGDNRRRLYSAMLAAMALRAFPSPVFPDVPPEELRSYARHGEPDIAVAEDQEQVDKLLELRERVGRPKAILYDDTRGLSRYRADGLEALDAAIVRGLTRIDADPSLAVSLVGRAQPGDIAVLLHSSGTTGVPKGVPLRHCNIIAAVSNAVATGFYQDYETHYAYLPMAWVGDFAFTIGAGTLLRFTTHVPERQETVLRDMREVASTIYFAAPRAWDNMLTRVQIGMADSTPFKRRLFEFFMPRAIGIEREKLAGKPTSVVDRIVTMFGEVLVFGPIKDFLGMTRLRRAYTGGEAMGEDTFLFFRGLGIDLRQFYGQTETAALTAVQADGFVTLHGVGRPMQGVNVRIDESGEILVHSGSVVDGYFDDPQASASALADGWLRTGDAGYVEPNGQLVVLGRVSEVIRTRAGERFIPNYIENRIKFSPYVRNVAVIGAGRDELTAIVCIELEAVGHWAEERGLSYASYADLSQKPEVAKLVAAILAHVNESLPGSLRVQRFVNLHKDFDADDGEVTRTRKLRRSVIEQRYRTLIEALYSGARSVVENARVTYESGQTGMISRTLSICEVT